MDQARNAVKGFTSRDGKHDTTVHETNAPAVTNETVAKQHHEETTTAVDREVHQDHYHTSVQPVNAREVVSEKHHHHAKPVEHREHHHGDADGLNRGLEREAAKFQNTRTEAPVKETHSNASTVQGEHVHHHVHEAIQPVIQKETIVPHVTHTTVPIHEVHHNEAKHHAASALPAVSMDEFKNQGGATSRGENVAVFEGHPQSLGQQLGSSGASKLGHSGDGVECSCGKTPGQNCKVHPHAVAGHGPTRDRSHDRASATAGPGASGARHEPGPTGGVTGGALSSRDKPLPQPGTNTAGMNGAAGSTRAGGAALGHGSGAHDQKHGPGSTAGSSMGPSGGQRDSDDIVRGPGGSSQAGSAAHGSTGTSGGHRDSDGIIRVPAGSSPAGSAAHGGPADSTHGTGVTGGTPNGGPHRKTRTGSGSSHSSSDTPGKKPGMLDRLREKLH